MIAYAREQETVPESILSPGVKNLLENSRFGRWGLGLGRAIRRSLRKLQDPVQHKIWVRQFVLPLRNVFLWNRPLRLSFGEIPVLLTPCGSTAGDIWAGLRLEQSEVSFVLEILEPGMTFFDVGANAGLFAVSAAKKIGGRGVFAFEPCSSTCEILQRNLRLNGADDVHVEQVALGEFTGEATLQVNARGKDGLNTLGQASHPSSQVIGQEHVRITTLDTFMKEHNVPRVDAMKADIEGAELMLFRGAKELLQRRDAPIILYEGFGFLTRGFGYHPVEILWFLESCGYTLFVLNSETGEISELKPDYQYDSMVIAAKPGHPSYTRVRAGLK